MDLNKYTEEMKKSLWDKAFFMDKIIGAKCVIDFGCADGALICMLKELFPSIDFYGFDNNEELLARARENYGEDTSVRKFFYNEKELNLLISDVLARYDGSEICINFSCVLHEVFSSSPSGQRSIQRLVKALEPKYVTVRDMFFPVADYTQDYRWRVVDLDEKYVNEFEMKYGSIIRTQNFLHFMMKYQWKDNGWEEELKENYFSWSITNLLDLMNKDEYKVIYCVRYLLPYYADKWAYLNLDPNRDTTHIQLVLRRNQLNVENSSLRNTFRCSTLK